MSELDLLERAYDGVPAPDASQIARARAELLQLIAAEGPRRSPLGERLRRLRAWPLRRLSLVVVGAVIVAVLFAAAATFRDSPAEVGTAQAACRGSGLPAEPCLLSLASIARRAGTRSGIVYQRTVLIDPMVMLPPGSHENGWPLAGVRRPFVVLATMIEETWIDPRSGRGVRRIVPGTLRFATPADRAAWKASGSPSWRRITRGRIVPDPSFRSLADGEDLYLYDSAGWRKATGRRQPARALPADPAALTRFLQRVSTVVTGRARNWPAFTPALADPLLTPGQRAALLTVIARTPRARLVGLRRDPLGRRGIAISTPYDPAKPPGVWPDWVYLYDPRTSRLLAEGIQGSAIPGRTGARRHFQWVRVFEVARGSARALPTPSANQ